MSSSCATCSSRPQKTLRSPASRCRRPSSSIAAPTRCSNFAPKPWTRLQPPGVPHPSTPTALAPAAKTSNSASRRPDARKAAAAPLTIRIQPHVAAGAHRSLNCWPMLRAASQSRRLASAQLSNVKVRGQSDNGSDSGRLHRSNSLSNAGLDLPEEEPHFLIPRPRTHGHVSAETARASGRRSI
jgi:hypothetical protein